MEAGGGNPGGAQVVAPTARSAIGCERGRVAQVWTLAARRGLQCEYPPRLTCRRHSRAGSDWLRVEF